MKKFDENYMLLEEMYHDNYYPTVLVDKVKNLILEVIQYLEQDEHTIEEIQEKLDEMTIGINDLQDEFDENDSEIETVARECICDTVEYIMRYFGVDIDTETAVQNRDW